MSASPEPWGENVLIEPAFAMIRDRVTPGTTVLDVGCGTGEVGAFLASSGATVDGLEPSVERSARARHHLRKVATCSLADAISSGELRQTYDVVVALDVIEHFVDPLEALTQIQEFMTDESRLFLFIPNSAHWSFRKKMIKGDWSYHDWGLFDRTHLRFFDPSTAEDLCRAANLKIVHRAFTTPAPSAVTQIGLRLRPRLFALHVLFELRTSTSEPE